MAAVLFDSSVYITAIRRGGLAVPLARTFGHGVHVWLSAVVLEELYAGASKKDQETIEFLERDFRAVNRVLVPNITDWALAGQILARLAAKYSYEEIGRGRLTNDALIATSAGRQGVMILTKNDSDFARIAEFRTFRWEIM